jgi:hypothetical protein
MRKERPGYSSMGKFKIILIALLFLLLFFYISQIIKLDRESPPQMPSLSPPLPVNQQQQQQQEQEQEELGFEVDFLQLKISTPTTTSTSTSNSISARNYGIVLDAGSSGTRMFIYSWLPASPTSPQLISMEKADELGGSGKKKQVEPGISSQTPEGVGDYLDPLLKFAYSTIPIEKQSTTPLFLFATAGMRLVAKGARRDLLQSACHHTQTNTIFYVGKCENHFRVISGEMEG